MWILTFMLYYFHVHLQISANILYQLKIWEALSLFRASYGILLVPSLINEINKILDVHSLKFYRSQDLIHRFHK